MSDPTLRQISLPKPMVEHARTQIKPLVLGLLAPLERQPDCPEFSPAQASVIAEIATSAFVMGWFDWAMNARPWEPIPKGPVDKPDNQK